MKKLIATYGIFLLMGGFLNLAHAADQIPGVAANPESYFYTGKPYDRDLESYVFSARTYNPEFSRWTSADPSGFPNGANNSIYTNSPGFVLDTDGMKLELVEEIAVSIDTLSVSDLGIVGGSAGLVVSVLAEAPSAGVTTLGVIGSLATIGASFSYNSTPPLITLENGDVPDSANWVSTKQTDSSKFDGVSQPHWFTTDFTWIETTTTYLIWE